MKILLKGALLAATVMTPGTVSAQVSSEPNADGVATNGNEIIVTARKKEETLLDAPLAVTVLGEAELEQGGYTDITEITKASPGAFVEPTGNNVNGPARINSTPRFRGVSVLSGDRLQQTATVFVDGVYLSGGIETIGINELQRVEIIKGPQSALFGRNTFAGAINYVTKDPSDEFRVDLDVTAATRNEYRLSAGIEGPLFDGLSFRAGGNYITKDGHFDNAAVDGQRLGDQEQWSINGSLLFEPSSAFRLKLRGSYQEITDGPAAAASYFGTAQHNFGGFLINADGSVDLNDSSQPAFGNRTESVFRGQITQPPASAIGQNSGADSVALYRGFLDDGRSDPSDAIFDFKYNPTNVDEFGLNLDSLQLSATGSVDLSDNIEFSFLAGYNEENFGFFSDFDLTPGQSFLSFSARETEDLTLEGRLQGNFLDDDLTVLVGASYVTIDINELGGTASFFGPTIFFSDIFREVGFLSGAETIGVFGLIDYQFTDTLSITLEGRYQEDEIYEDEVNVGLTTPTSPASISNFLPRATLRYQPSSDTTLYATYSEGNLPGGFNAEVAQLDAAQLTELNALAPDANVVFGEEKLVNYELGWKQQFDDGKVAFNLALFHMQRKNELFNSFEVVTDTRPMAPNPLRTVQFLANGATTDIFGIELDAALQISDEFSMQGSFAYIDSSIASFPATGGSGDFGDIFGNDDGVVGQEAPRFPPITLSLGTKYEDQFNGLGDMIDTWYLRTDLFFTSEYYVSNANVAEVEPATDVNVRFGLQGENLGVELFVTNLFDEDAPTSAQNFADTGFGTRTLPGGFFNFSREGARVILRDRRQFGLRLSYSFQ